MHERKRFLIRNFNFRPGNKRKTNAKFAIHGHKLRTIPADIAQGDIQKYLRIYSFLGSIITFFILIQSV